MANEQTPRDVLIAHQRLDISSCCCGWGELGQSFCQHQIDALDAAGFAIVRKPTGDRLEAAVAAFNKSYSKTRGPLPRLDNAVAAALAAAAAADGRTPDDQPNPIDLVRELRAALGLSVAANPGSPREVWEEAIEHARGLAAGQCGECMRRAERERRQTNA